MSLSCRLDSHRMLCTLQPSQCIMLSMAEIEAELSVRKSKRWTWNSC